MAKRKPLILALLALAAAIGIWYALANRNAISSTPKTPPPVPVTTAQASAGEIPLLLDVVGRAEAHDTVTVKSRVDGMVASVAYTEGQAVKQGTVLVQLDTADFNARLAQAEASLSRDQAQLIKMQADVARYASLKAQGFISDEKLNEIRTNAAAAAATVKADQAAVDLARLQLSYATIRAPFSGIVGARLAFPGTAVKINDTALAVVNRIHPLYVTFAVPEKHLPRLRAALADGPLRVAVGIPGSKMAPITGSARFIDNAVDTATGTIQMKAVVDNQNATLTPGQFLGVSLTLDVVHGSALVPAEAIQQGADGNFLYLVKPDNTVENRKIRVLGTFKGVAAVESGVSPGETVVTDGQLRLVPGSSVLVKKAETPAAAVAQSQPPTR